LLGDTDKAAIWHEHWGEALEALGLIVESHPQAVLKHYSGFGPTSLAPGQDTLAFLPERLPSTPGHALMPVERDCAVQLAGHEDAGNGWRGGDGIP
jgi:hypothetical protein